MSIKEYTDLEHVLYILKIIESGELQHLQNTSIETFFRAEYIKQTEKPYSSHQTAQSNTSQQRQSNY